MAESKMVDVEPERFEVVDGDAQKITVYRWRPEADPVGGVHLLHGMGEHALRYGRLAGALTAAGYLVTADDHRASGRTGEQGPGLGDLGPRGMEGALDSVGDVLEAVGVPGLDLTLLGHSWGSFLGQRIALGHGLRPGSPVTLAGLVLSGSTLLVPEHLPGPDMNQAFEPAITPYDWLSRDVDEVQRYMADPWCGLEVSFPMEELLYLGGAPDDRLVAGLPILVMNGSADAVGGLTAGGAALADAYRGLGASDVTYLEYAEGRHELFNETNRQDVTSDLLTWLGAQRS